jgi:hypothetical protein
MFRLFTSAIIRQASGHKKIKKGATILGEASPLLFFFELMMADINR